MITVLDFDGTVADTMPDLTIAAVKVISECYGVGDPVAIYRSTVGASFPDQLEELFPGDPRNPLAAADFLELQTAVYSHSVLTATAPEAINLLFQHEVDVAIISSSLSALTSHVLARQLPHAAPHITLRGREDGTKLEQLTELAYAFGHSSVTFIGDAPRDHTVAVAAGVRFIGVEHTFVASEFEGCRVTSDLLAAVRELVG